MEYLTPRLAAEIAGGRYIGDAAAGGARIIGAARDSNDVKPGNMFVCVRGARVDGHDFAGAALASGAVCCLAERELPDLNGPYILVGSTLEAIRKIGAYHRQRFDIPVIGIAGSVGKTTAKELVAAVLGARYRIHKTEKNLNNELGVPLTLLSLSDEHQAAVIEMGISEFGEMSRLAEMVQPDILVMTQIGHSHLKDLGDLDGVLRAKSEVFAYMPGDGAAVLNGDDERLRGYDPGIRKLTFGQGAHNDFRAENVRMEGTDAVLCDISSDTGTFTMRIPAYGHQLAYLAPAAAAVARLLGMTDDEICRGALSYAPVGGRANVHKTGYLTIIDDCYNANPQSVRAALSSLSGLQGRRAAILGDMLNLSVLADELHYEIGEHAARCGVDALICCGEKSAFICEGYTAAGGKNARRYTGNAQLAAALPELVAKDDVVLVKASRDMHFEDFLPVLKAMSAG